MQQLKPQWPSNVMSKLDIQDIYAPIQEVPIDLIIGPNEWLTKTKYNEFTWLEPVLEPVQCTPSLSTQEKYSMAVDGYRESMAIPLTKCITRLKGKVRLRCTKAENGLWYSWSIQFWLIPSKYSAVKEPKLVAFQDEYTLTPGPRSDWILEEYILTSLHRLLT